MAFHVADPELEQTAEVPAAIADLALQTQVSTVKKIAGSKMIFLIENGIRRVEIVGPRDDVDRFVKPRHLIAADPVPTAEAVLTD